MMKKLKIILAVLLIVASAALIIYSAQSQVGLTILMDSLDPAGLAQNDAKMQKARDRVLESQAEDDREKILRNLERYTEGFESQLNMSLENRTALFFYRHGRSFIALGLFLMVAAAALYVNAAVQKNKYRKISIYLVLIAALYAGVYILENVVGPNSMLLTVLKKGVIYALIAVSMNLLNGFTGLFSLGQAGFMLIGAYTYAIFTIATESRDQVYQYFDGGLIQFQLPTLVAIALAGLAAAFFAFLVGLPVLRLKSDYLAIATLGFAEIIRAIFQYNGLGPITNGSNLLRKFTTFETVLFPFAVVGVCVALIGMLIHSTYGRSFKAIRDDEIAAEAMGINLFRHKQMAFVISSCFDGVGGALLAMYQTTVQASAFMSTMTYEVLLIVVIGGMGSITGSILASFLFVASSEWWLRFLDNDQMIGNFQVPLLRSGFRMVVFSVIIMAVVLFYRKGIMGDKELNLERVRALFRGRGGKANG